MLAGLGGFGLIRRKRKATNI
ncbi:hypothetical protein [uncultured Celeribacter sp.]